MEEEFQSEIVKIQNSFKKREVKLRRLEGSAFPQLIVTVPDSWETIQLAPLYDVHIGGGDMDMELFQEHMDWIKKTKNVLTWNGGDLVENANKFSPGGSVTAQKIQPQEQLYEAARILAPIQHKMLFAIPGNHEDRTFAAAGIDSAKFLAEHLQLPYFSDYCFCTIKWKGNNFRLMAHHGSGGGATPGAQRNSARKDLPWAGKMDLVWTGHLHQPMTDLVFQAEYDQKTGEMVERNTLVIISPSYVKYFGGYAAKKRLAPGVRGLGVVILNANGRIDASMHARGKRL
jgi:hypothetical protein